MIHAIGGGTIDAEDLVIRERGRRTITEPVVEAADVVPFERLRGGIRWTGKFVAASGVAAGFALTILSCIETGWGPVPKEYRPQLFVVGLGVCILSALIYLWAKEEGKTATPLPSPPQPYKPFTSHFDENIKRDPQFTGRKSKLRALARMLDLPLDGAASSTTVRKARPIAVIEGGPGMGKSTLAAEFAHQQHDSLAFAGARLVLADRANALAGGISEILKYVNLAYSEQSTSTGDSRPGQNAYLVIFENVDTPRQRDEVLQLRAQLPQTVRILVTTHDSTGFGVKPLRLDKFGKQEAVALLRKLADSRDDNGAAALAKELDNHPLALHHAGLTCRDKNWSFDQYRNLLLDQLANSTADDASLDSILGRFSITIDLSLEAALTDATGRVLPGVMPLIGFLCYCYAENVPCSLYRSAVGKAPDDVDGSPTNAELDEAVNALKSVGLIWTGDEYVGLPGAGSTGERSLSMHRLVQNYLRGKVDRDGQSGDVIGRLMPRLCTLLALDRADTPMSTDATDSALRRYLPHFLAALPHLDAPDFRGNEGRDVLDSISKLLVFQFQRPGTLDEVLEDDKQLRQLPLLFGCFYEINPLEKPLALILKAIGDDRAKWETFRDDCLAQNNYVLRFALAEALADAIKEGKVGFDIDRALDLVSPDQSVNRFELGGYAFKSLASKNPAIAREHRDKIAALASYRFYFGRSILGDLMLNLVYQDVDVVALLPPETKAGAASGTQANAHFWQPIWDFVAYDVGAVIAYLQHGGKAVPPVSPKVSALVENEERAYLTTIEDWRETARVEAATQPTIAALVGDYFVLGTDTDRIGDEAKAFANLLADGQGAMVLRLLFGHPLWSVAESAASMIACLFQEDSKEVYSKAIKDLIDQDEPWRVHYGATEAAFQIRQFENTPNATFFDAVDRFHASPNTKLAGLCAENLFSILLNQGDATHKTMRVRHETAIQHWLKSEDCWVLEHVHRYFHALHLRSANDKQKGKASDAQSDETPLLNPDELAAPSVSRLLEGLNEWWEVDRGEFLLHIEQRKKALATKTVAA